MGAMEYRLLLERLEALARLERWGDKTTARRDPATEAAIAKAESRLTVILPDSYKSFLRCTNGYSGFGVPAQNMYATSEHMYMGVVAPDRDQLYLFEDDLYFELREDSILVTNLYNFTVPLIRHELNDVLRPTGELHGPFRLVENVIGRTEDVPFFVNEEGRRDFIHPIVIAEFYAPRLRSFQFRVADESSFKFAVVLEPGLDEGERALTKKDIRERLDGLLARKRMRNVRFDLEEVEELRAPERGKFRMVVTPPV